MIIAIIMTVISLINNVDSGDCSDKVDDDRK